MFSKITASLIFLLIPVQVIAADVLSEFSNETLPTLNDNLRKIEDSIRDIGEINGTALPEINLANGTGTVPVSSIAPTGTANSSTFLRGDQAWVPILKMSHVTYTGNGVDNRGITHELNATPQLAIINRADVADTSPILWTVNMESGLSRLFSGGHRDNSIQVVNATHVQIGTEIEVNDNNVVYDLFTFSEQ